MAYYICLTGAKKNIGDYLISNRAMQLLEKFGPQHQYNVYQSWMELKDLNFINSSAGIIILGGPGIRENTYPNIYPLTSNLELIKVPIYLLGSGLKMEYYSKEFFLNFNFSNPSKLFFEKLINQKKFSIGIRDIYTKELLDLKGYTKNSIIGCPAWYDLAYLNKRFGEGFNHNSIVFTPAQNPKFKNLVLNTLLFLKKRFKSAKIVVSFHRGIDKKDEFSSQKEIDNNLEIAEFSKRIGFDVVDTSYDLNKIEFYKDFDLHIGFRVHAHINFISMKKKSILINEDIRGQGANLTLKTVGIDAFLVKSKLNLIRNHNNKLFSKIYKLLNYKVKKDIDIELNNIIEKMANNDLNFDETDAVLKSSFNNMQGFLQGILE